MQSTKTLLAAALVVLSGSSLLFAQTDRATLTGTVTDQSGALIPGATVTAIHTATNATRNVQTNATGEFVLPQLVVGDYNIKAEAAGFKSSTTTGVTLSPGATIRADIKLEVGQITESVSVSAQASLIQTDTARVQTAVSPK